jgi:hypothetical protein
MMRKCFALILSVLLLAIVVSHVQALAASQGPKTPPPPSEKTQVVAPLTTLWLSAWNCSISQQSSNTVLLSGYADANIPVNQIWVILYLQRWNGSQWITVSNGYKSTGTNTPSITGKQTLTVTLGYYYRAMGNYQCYNNGIYDPSQPEVSTSGYIYVD